MANGGNKAKGRQSGRNAKYYDQQFFVTTANKLRREKARKRRRENYLRNIAARIKRREPVPKFHQTAA